MKGFSTLALLIASTIPNVTAHYRWTSLIANGAATTEYQYVRTYTSYNSPVTDVTSTDFTCNTGSSPVAGIASVVAGSVVGFKLDQPIYHPGVINVYAAKVPSGKTAANWDGSGTLWFKVSQLSAVTNGGTSISWPSNNLAEYTFTLPKSTPSGDYLLRIEHIALHVAQSFGAAQFYISCGQITVTGGGSGIPGPLVAIPGVYTGNEPGILININWPIPPTYTQPGPAVWTG